MNRQFGDAHFTSIRIEDRVEGYEGYDLARIRRGKNDLVARIIFWDASGQFTVETLGSDVPLGILEELIAEAKATIKTG